MIRAGRSHHGTQRLQRGHGAGELELVPGDHGVRRRIAPVASDGEATTLGRPESGDADISERGGTGEVVIAPAMVLGARRKEMTGRARESVRRENWLYQG